MSNFYGDVCDISRRIENASCELTRLAVAFATTDNEAMAARLSRIADDIGSLPERLRAVAGKKVDEQVRDVEQASSNLWRLALGL